MNESYLSGNLQNFISNGEDETLTHYNFSILELMDDNIEIPIRNILENDYLDELRSIAIDFEFTDKDFATYKYKPHLLSLVLYDTPELYFVILAINDMISKKDFCERKIKLIKQSDLLTILDHIYNAELEYIEDNRENLH